jgi:hypothetical protein
MRSLKGSRHTAWKEILSPHVLGLAGLAFAISIWAFGYRLSIYFEHPTPTLRASAAKLWIEPRNASAAAASRLIVDAHRIAGSAAISLSIRPFPRLDRALICAPPERTHRPASFGFLIPFRSPPPQRFYIA